MFTFDIEKLPPDVRRLLDKTPPEFGEVLAKRHLKMIENAVKEWAKKNAEKMDCWKIEYAKQIPDTDIVLRVYNPNGESWFWQAWDAGEPESEFGAICTLPGYDTKEQAAQAAETWLKDEGLKQYQELSLS